MLKLLHNCTHLTLASKVMFKILQARLQQYVNSELPDVQAGFRKGRGTRDQIANTHEIIEKGREFQKSISFSMLSLFFMVQVSHLYMLPLFFIAFPKSCS